MIGWHCEVFARTKTLKPLGEYLGPASAAESQRDRGAQQIRGMFERMIRKQEARDGTG